MAIILPSILLLVVGLALLYQGAAMLIGNSTRLAKNLGIPLIVVGFTIVALGTSVPELIVGVFSALEGKNSITLGAVLGSNMANIGLALGLAALISPVGLPSKDHRFELYTMVLAVGLMYMLLRDGNLDRIDGLILVTFAAVFTYHALRDTRREKKVEQMVEKAVTIQNRREKIFNVLGIAAGLVLLLVGGSIAVNNSVALARLAGVSEILIGLSLIAIGTSLPEIITTVLAAIKKESHISVGNIIGSNIMNILLVLGISVLIHPITVQSTVWRYDLPFLLIVSLILLGLASSDRKITRRESVILLSVYAAYIAFAFLLRIE
jgi:cation:H+ antiporter